MTPTQPPIKVRALFCPNCGGTVELRGFASTLTAVCAHCNTMLDAGSGTLRILHQFESRQIRKPAIPLGTRGKFDSTTYEVIGFQVRGVEDEGVAWEWAEYLLFNPYKGYRYLTEYQGHWNMVRPVYGLPLKKPARVRPGVEWRGRTYRHFQHSMARTLFVLGEFPWRVTAGEAVILDDYTCPPYLLSAECTDNETTWSEGEYIEGRHVWQALGLKGSPPRPQGIFLNQPNPSPAATSSAIKLCVAFELALLGLLLFFLIFERREVVLNQTHVYRQQASGEASYVTPVFELKGRTSNVRVVTTTDLDNHWVYFNYALINSDSGQGYDFGREVSYYHGHDSDGDWNEGGRTDRATIPSVPPGRYYLRVEPEAEPNAPPVNYVITVQRDVPSYVFYLIAGLLLPLPAIGIVWRRYRFEYQRWQESDYAVKSAKGGD